MAVTQASTPSTPASPVRHPTTGSIRPNDRSIRYVKGVGPNRVLRLAQLGIETVEDACLYPPRRYEDRRRLATIRDLTPAAFATVRVHVLARSLRRLHGGRTLVEAAMGDPTGVLYALWFNQPYLAQQLTVGDELFLYGRLEAGSKRQVIHPELEWIEGAEETSLHMGRIVPIYPLVSGLGQRWFRQVIASVVERFSGDLEETLPDAIRRKKDWPRLDEAVRELHFPTTWESLQRAQDRLAFDELFVFQLALAQRRARVIAQAKPQRYHVEGPLTVGLRQQLPFALTASQQQVLEELFRDLAQPHPMQRLLQGDVGCGKTIVVAFLLAAAVQSGHQAVLMAPTELLAEQHARVIRSCLAPLGVSVGLLAQGVDPAQRARCVAEAAGGRLDIVVGTHALLQGPVQFQRLALVVIDEQHKFGVAQRAQLAKKARVPDVLVLTATPIPRTLAMSLYGDLAVSTISELPPGRKPIATRWLRETDREELDQLIRAELSQGRQGYVVYPLVEPQDQPDEIAGQGTGQRRRTSRGVNGRQARELKAATQMAKQLQAMFPEFRVGLLHGQMKSKDKEDTMRAFVQGAVQLLVSTVIVEVGLDVPNATLMVIEHPERFGLAQLHQLRGRIGRGERPATCVVVSDATDSSIQQRLSAFVETTDGFALAEKDLELRGPGELLGRRQHGWLRFRIANLSRDRSLHELARHEAATLIARDPDVRGPALAGLRQRLAQFRHHPA